MSDVRFVAIDQFESEQQAVAAAAWLEADDTLLCKLST
jgi:hypothetical protein